MVIELRRITPNFAEFNLLAGLKIRANCFGTILFTSGFSQNRYSSSRQMRILPEGL